MTKTKFLLITFAIAFAMMGLKGNIPQSQAQETPLNLLSLEFKRPSLSPRGAPGDRTGGGTRGGCPALETKEDLTALVPEFQASDSSQITHVWGLTTKESPSFWFYLPYAATDLGVGELELWDATDTNPRNYQQIYKGSFTITETPGVIGLSLPSEIKLETGKNYYWYLSVPVKCELQSIYVKVYGWVERVEAIPELSAQLSEREQVRLLAENGIWFDALELLAELRKNHPENASLTRDWKKLLEDVNLQNIAYKKIAPCCSFNQVQN